MQLRYGMNPHQQPATAVPVSAGRSPVRVMHGLPSYINMLDALGAWQLVREASTALGRHAAASFKHVSPAGAALEGPLDALMAETYGLDASTVGPLTSAYVRARDADPQSSYGDFVAVSAPVDAELAGLLRRLPCDGIIAPGYESGTVTTLAAKKNGTFLILAADATYEPPAQETRDVYGLRFTQPRDDLPLTREQLTPVNGHALPDQVIDDLLLGLIVLRHTQSNSVAYLRDGMTLGVAAGQQSRIGCTRLAGTKADTWWLRRHPKLRALAIRETPRIQDRISRQFRYLDGDLTSGPDPLTGAERREWLTQFSDLSFVSDGAIPFRDNIDHAADHGVRYLAEPGGSIHSTAIRAACQEHGITLLQTGIRLFHH